MWSTDSAPNTLANIARIPVQTTTPASIADSVIRSRTQSRKTRKIHFLGIWGSAAAAIVAGIVLWHEADKPVTDQHQTPQVAAPTTQTDHSFMISEIDTKPLEIKVRKFTKLGTQALKQKGQAYANTVKGIRSLVVSLSDL